MDRGDDSRGVIDQVIGLRQSERFEVRTLKGDHEETLLEFLNDPSVGPTRDGSRRRRAAQPAGGEALGRRLAMPAFWVLLALISFWTLAPVEFRPQTGHPFLERFLAFLGLGAALAAAYPRRIRLTLAAVAVISVGLEALQLLAPTRDARAVDAAEKLAGGLTGLALYWGASRIARGKHGLPPFRAQKAPTDPALDQAEPDTSLQ